MTEAVLASLLEQMPARETTRLPNATPAEAGLGLWAFAATVAYPENTTRRDKLLFACKVCWLAVRPRLGHRAEAAWRTSSAWGRDPKSVKHIMQDAEWRIRFRLVAAERLLLSQIFRGAARAGPVSTYKQIGQSLRGYSRAGMAPHNVQYRIWRQSLPVLHLSLALRDELVVSGLGVAKWPGIAAGDSQRTLARMVAKAEQWRLILTHPSFRGDRGLVDPAEQIRLLI